MESSWTTVKSGMSAEERNKNELIECSVSFVRAITKCLGPDKGLEIWNTLADLSSDELKFEVFKLMLNGNGNKARSVTLLSADSDARVATIKMVRRYSGMGLKESKEATDKVMGYDVHSVGGKPTGTPVPIKFKVRPVEVVGTDLSPVAIRKDFESIGADVEVF